MHKVSVVKCSSYRNAEVRKSLEESLKNIDFSFKKNLKVLIKPNILSPHPPEAAITTHPAIIEELCKILKKYNAKIFIGESSSYNTNLGFEVSGIGKLKGCKIINFETQEKKLKDIGEIKKVPLPKILDEVDLIINVAKLKTHVFTGTTLSVKNLYGCIPGRAKSLYHKILKTPKTFTKFLLALHSEIKPQLNIIDGIVGIEGNGPGSSGALIKSKRIIAGKNAEAVDIVSSEIMGVETYISKLSKIKKQDIEVIGEKASLNFKKPLSSLLLAVPIFHFINSLFPKSRVKFNHKNCTKCHLCEKKCPVKAIALSPWPGCNYKKCIRCLCCIEVCPNSAVSLEEHKIKKLARKIYRKFLNFKG